jgi:hypothetical protein
VYRFESIPSPTCCQVALADYLEVLSSEFQIQHWTNSKGFSMNKPDSEGDDTVAFKKILSSAMDDNHCSLSATSGWAATSLLEMLLHCCKRHSTFSATCCVA